jgi:biopolymer transport protein ExbD
MNVTPLIDVLLTLLVIFMIITPITPLGEKALIPHPPPKHEKPQLNNRSVVLQVLTGPQGQPELKINQQDVSWQDLTNRLVTIYETRGEKVLFVKADDDIPWQDVAMVVARAHNAGVDKVGLMTAKAESSG